MKSSPCFPKDIRLQPSEDVPARTRYYRCIDGRSPPSPKQLSLTIDITPKSSTHEDDRTQSIDQQARSGKLERSIASPCH
ncbi:hypothetical protein QUB33_28130 [Microcoleus sp. B3-A4]|uniref:hypothetical protein n=1 Tax=Microcoleus sp. B3-A4 TaxID=2818653 RepID=UPI002FD09E6D